MSPRQAPPAACPEQRVPRTARVPRTRVCPKQPRAPNSRAPGTPTCHHLPRCPDAASPNPTTGNSRHPPRGAHRCVVMQAARQTGQLGMPLLFGAVAGPALQLQQPALWDLAGVSRIARGRPRAVRHRSSMAARPAAGACLRRLRVGGAGDLRAVRQPRRGVRPARARACAGRQRCRGHRHRRGDAAAPRPRAAVPVRGRRGPHRRACGPPAAAALGGLVCRPVGRERRCLRRPAPGARAARRRALAPDRAAEGAARQPQSARLRLRAVAVGAGRAGHRLRARGPRDAAPERLGATWRHPVERARQAVRDAIVRSAWPTRGWPA